MPDPAPSTPEKAGLAKRAVAYFRDAQVPLWRRLLGVGAVAYVVMPFDAIPDFIPVLGWLDDLGVLGVVAWYLVRQIQKHDVTPRAQDP